MTIDDDTRQDDVLQEDDDAGFVGGGGPAAQLGDDSDELDEHGDNLATVDDDEL